jgi:hypothetical protein
MLFSTDSLLISDKMMDLNQFIRRIIKLVMQAQELASQIGIFNILQPGLVKEMIIAETLGHKLI